VCRDLTPQEVVLSPDGTYMYVLGSTGGRVYQYTLGTPWLISTASFTASTSVTTQEAAPLGLYFSATGTRMWVIGSTADRVFQYDLGCCLGYHYKGIQ
jgi:DNA-binding beta-propeller fold protein YncE